MASPKVLQEWCRVTCAGYSNVEVKDWSSSFRSGLAFCAIIHKHRPELIDFSSLPKDNAYQNNKLAFEVAETKLGIPMLLDAKEVLCAQGPDHLAVITYISQLYFLFNKKSIDLASLQSSCVAISSQKTKSLTHLESAEADSLSATKPRVACHQCFKPVHLIQRRVVGGIIYHRKCFRCKHCQLSLLPGTYAKGNIANSLLCSHHAKSYRESTSRDTCGYLSLSGLAVSSVPYYPTKIEPPDKLVCKDSEKRPTAALYSSVQRASAQSPVSEDDESGCSDERQEAGIAREDTENILGGDAERGKRPVPTPRRRVTSYGTTSSQNMSSSAIQGISDKTSDSAPVATQLGSSSGRGRCRVTTNHPWLKIIHPGPWTQLPPAPPPVHPLRAKSVRSLSGVWYNPGTPAPNPFYEGKNETAKQKLTEKEVVTEQNSEGKDDSESEVKEVGEVIGIVNNDLDQREDSPTFAEDLQVQTTAESTEEALSDSEAALPTSSDNLSEGTVPSSTTEAAAESSAPESETCHLSAFPGHGFPLIKRKVQTDPCTSPEDLQQQMGQVTKHLEALEEKGVELERRIRGCSNNKEEEKLLMDWFSLVHQRHVLARKDTELVYIIKQQELEQRQEDVEYKLRCLLNKPEGEWTEQHRQQEQQLMQELLNIIEQRNQIISSLDQDVQRERAEDLHRDSTVKNKDFQKRELKELKKSTGKFKTTSVFKILNKKSESQREKKS
uniref:MICAL like 1b, duplicate 2 n=1 Tax=Neogobius melanostomus TaxID=47308 RepID=A0A8C6SP73_9GOBI